MKHHFDRWLRKWFVILPLAIAIVLAVSFLARGWVRSTLEPRSVGLFYKSSVEKTFNQEVNKLGNPLEAMGYKSITKTSTCRLSVARGIHTEIACTTIENAYSKVSDLKKNGSELVSNAAKIEGALQNNNWGGIYGLGTNPYTSLTRLSTSLTSGIDWQPDAAYTKNIGSTTCAFDSNTSFSRPAPAAISSRFDCTRTIDIFGNPWLLDKNGNKYFPLD